METHKIHLFEALIDREVFTIENEIASITKTSVALLRNKEYDQYLKNAEKMVQMSRNINYLLDFKIEVVELMTPSGLAQAPKAPSISKVEANEESNNMESLIKAVADLAEEKPSTEPKKKIVGGLGDLAKSFDGVGNNNIPKTNAETHTGEDGEVYESYGA